MPYSVPRFSVNAIALKVQTEINLANLKSIQEQNADSLSAWCTHTLSTVIASLEQQIDQLDEDIRLNKIL